MLAATVGLFGVGFSSACLVSDKDRVVSWESVAGSSFTVQKVTEMVHGGVKCDTEITFYWKEDLTEFLEERRLKEDQSEFSEERRLKDLVMILPEFVGFPIGLYVENLKEKEVPDSGEDEKDNRGGR